MRIFKNKLLLGTIVLFLTGMTASALFTGKVIELAGSAQVLLSCLLSLIPAMLWLWLFFQHNKYDIRVFISFTFRVKGGNIQTLLMESEPEVRPPCGISHNQWFNHYAQFNTNYLL
jgi:hypothetical protein